MDYKLFIKLNIINIRNSIKYNNIEKILPIKDEELEIIYVNEARIILIKDEESVNVWAKNEYFLCSDIIKAICYSYDIKYVDNIVRNQRITRVPKAQRYFKGVINLRGEIIPVMSLRLKFKLEPDEYTNATRIIIIKLEPQSAIGIIVDEVKEVVTLGGNSIEKADTSDPSDPMIQYLSGIGKRSDGLISLLNISAVIVGREGKDEV